MKIPAPFFLQSHLARLPKSLSMRQSKFSPRIKAGVYTGPDYIIEGVLGEKARDLGMLREPMHRIFANWQSTPEGALRFTRKCGPLFTYEGREGFAQDASHWLNLQAQFRELWTWHNQRENWGKLIDYFRETFKYKPAVSELDSEHTVGCYIPEGPVVSFNVILERRHMLLAVVPVELWQYLLLLVMREKLGVLRICANPDCAAPYFIARRRDQQFCGTDCAGLIAKRRWWADHGKAWRDQRRQKGKARKGKKQGIE